MHTVQNTHRRTMKPCFSCMSLRRTWFERGSAWCCWLCSDRRGSKAPLPNKLGLSGVSQKAPASSRVLPASTLCRVDDCAQHMHCTQRSRLPGCCLHQHYTRSMNVVQSMCVALGAHVFLGVGCANSTDSSVQVGICGGCITCFHSAINQWINAEHMHHTRCLHLSRRCSRQQRRWLWSQTSLCPLKR